MGKHFGKSRYRIDIAEPGDANQAVQHRGALTAAIRSEDKPRLPAAGNAAQLTFGSVIRQADPLVGDERREPVPVVEHVGDHLGDSVVARQAGAPRASIICY